MALAQGHEALGRIIDALGLSQTHFVQRIVIVADVRGPVVVYVKKLAHEEEFDAIADNLVEPTTRGGEVDVTTVGGLEVDDRGRVFVPAADVTQMRKALKRIAVMDSVEAVRTAVAVARTALGDD